MGWLKQIKLMFEKPLPAAIFDRDVSANPLREFVYLDEVSLRSLLSSKKGEMTSSTSKETTETSQDEFRSTGSVGVSGVGKMELASRFQTSNSSTLQTAKKATVQSWFRELDKIPDLRLLETVQKVNPFSNKAKISTCQNSSICTEANNLKRGEIIEFKVRLSADPVFHLVTLFSEFKGMVEDYPSMMNGNGGLEQINEMEGLMKIVERLLAGLIPVRAEVLDYVVVEEGGNKFVTHIDAIKDLDIEYKPLEIVCVTELAAYWKDIRRVLFSNAEFTMLCRVSRDGLQNQWTPIKLADVLSGLVPDLTNQLDKTARLLFNSNNSQQPNVDKSANLRAALSNYKDMFLNEVSAKISDIDSAKVNLFIAEMIISDQSATSQNQAFKITRERLAELLSTEIDSSKDLKLREEARHAAGLTYFNSSTVSATVDSLEEIENTNEKPLLDVEVVAIYW